jgi:hypothetical protein
MKSSPYYPPRAGPLSRFLAMMDRLGFRIQRSLADRPALRWASPFPGGIPWLLLPGLMWRQEGKTTLGTGVMVAWAVLVTTHIVCLNPDLAGAAAIFASMLHAISAAAALTVLYPHWHGTSRLWRTSLISTLLVLLIYTFGLRNALLPIAQRITIQGSTVMIHQTGWFSEKPWTRGEWVAYRRLGGLTYMERILAIPGDTIRFHPESFEVNGRFFERLSEQMPKTGETVMDAGTYFIWPTEAKVFHGGDFELGLFLGLTNIAETDILGRPYRRWFWASPALENLKPVASPAP